MVLVVLVVMMNDKKTIMRSLDKELRQTNFDEVNLGYNEIEAKLEASRCLNCKVPRCVLGCPVNIMIPEFIQAILKDDVNLAKEIITSSSSLPAICGRVCPQEKQCEKMCVKGLRGDAISIGALERYVSDFGQIKTLKKEANNYSIGIVGSGPSGLTCAYELARQGYSVEIYEALHIPGGVLSYGIPSFRLPRNIVEEEIAHIRALGVKIHLNTLVGTTISMEELLAKHDGIYVATGAGTPKFMGIKNECASGVFSANEILTRVNLMNSKEADFKTPLMVGKRVMVVGGGNVAFDVARVMRRLGSEVTILYRRKRENLPAREEEVLHALEEGVNIIEECLPFEILVDEQNFVNGIKLHKTHQLVDNGSNTIKVLENQDFNLECDQIIVALGTKPNKTLTNNFSKLKTDETGLIIVEETKTNIDNIFAGGDATSGAATVILAMSAGKKAAKQIMELLK